MNLKVFFCIIGIILSMVYTAKCAQHDDSVFCAEVIVCDTNGKQYPTPCAFDDAKAANPCLEKGICPGSTGPVES